MTTLRQSLRTIYEIWAGSEGIPVPETAVEAYLLRLIEQMRDEASKALAEPEQTFEAENARLKKDVEQFQMALREQVELNKNLKRNLREFGIKVAEEVAKGVDYSWGERKPQLLKIVDEVMNKNLIANAGKMVDYPQWICSDCGTQHGNRPVGLATWHHGVCEVCGKDAAVTEPRDFGHLKDTWKRILNSRIEKGRRHE